MRAPNKWAKIVFDNKVLIVKVKVRCNPCFEDFYLKHPYLEIFMFSRVSNKRAGWKIPLDLENFGQLKQFKMHLRNF